MYGSSDVKKYIMLIVLANWEVRAGLNQFAEILGHCKPILTLKSAIFDHQKCWVSFFV